MSHWRVRRKRRSSQFWNHCWEAPSQISNTAINWIVCLFPVHLGINRDLRVSWLCSYIVTFHHSLIMTESLKALANQGLRISGSAAAAAAANSLQSCSTLCNLIDSSPPGSPISGILQARTLEWVAISFSNAWKWKVKGKSLSRVQLLATPWTAVHQVTMGVKVCTTLQRYIVTRLQDRRFSVHGPQCRMPS